MLSYLHGYHAGNHADLIKHISWLAVIDRLQQKNKPFTLIDTHAGAGCYSLDSEQALKTGEFKTGVALLHHWQPNHPVLQHYKQLIASYLDNQQYPGSPLISSTQLRKHDQLHAMELHPSEHQRLRQVFKQHRGLGHVHVHHRDGLEGVVALSPPKPNRGAILIDPPYEKREEYTSVVSAIVETTSRWPQAQIVLWYPLLSQRAGEKAGQSQRMIDNIAGLPRNVLKAELCVNDPAEDSGMYGSGVCVVNPSWQLDSVLNDVLMEVTPYLGDTAFASVNWLNKPD